MTTLACSNCRQPVAAADDICENCGAVLPSLSAGPVHRTAAASAAGPPVSAGSMTVCPNCQQPITPGDEVCEQCGVVLATTVTRPGRVPAPAHQQEECPQCHAFVTPGVKFCNHCGFRFATNTSPAASSAISQPPLAASMVHLGVGSVLNGKYQITKEIGAGGMGAVYLAEDQILKRRVVIKALLSDDDPDLVTQSIKEREFLAAVKHANIVSIYDFITVGTRGYIVMEYVGGKTLEQIMEERGQPFEAADAITYILGILPAFSYLAKLGLVYCDFKPSNVMLEVLKDGTQIVKLIDLGTVIKYVPKPDDVYGTHGFYAPEAVKAPSPQTDLYSICRTQAYMVTLMDLANPIFGMPAAEYYTAFRDHPELYRLLQRGTHAQPARRFQTAEELSDQLTGVLRFIVGGKPGMSASSRLFVFSVTTTSGKLGPRGEAALDENDKASDLLLAGDQALRSGNYDDALSVYRQAVSSHSRSLDAHVRLAEVLIDLGEFSQVEAELTWAQRLAPNHWKIAWYTGRFLEAQERFALAANAYQEVIADLPGELPPLKALARVKARADDDAAAVTLYTTVLKADPGNTDAILGITSSLLNLQHWNDAITVLNGVSEAAAKYVDAQLLLCDLYLNRIAPLTAQNIEQASHAVSALEGRTQDARYFLARGDVYRAAWQMARAGQLPPGVAIAAVTDTRATTLGATAEESYKEYLRRERHPADREAVVRRKFQVSPWRLW
ncbi:MAG: protein kinase [Chloroflexota bacterium]|nr:protein kinase [Chloroflexota bacterium]